MKKFITSILLSAAILLGTAFATVDFPYSGIDINPGTVDTNFTGILVNSIDDNTYGLKRLLHLFMPNQEMYGSEDSPSFLFYLKTVVNLLLSFVSLIALILMIYAFYMIFFKKDEAGTTTAKQMIKGIVVALVIIGLSWIVVSFLFRFEKENTENVGYNNNTEVVSSLT